MGKQNDKPERIQFPQGVTRQEILATMKEKQDEWAKTHPEEAHRLYPTVYNEKGERITTTT